MIDDAVREKALVKMDEYYRELTSWINAGNTCIFAFEGLGSGYGGTSEYHPSPYNFLNAMMVVTKGKEIVYVTRKASTLPDNRPDKFSDKQYKDKFFGTELYDKEYVASTTLEDGIYDYSTGFHNSSYLALKPSGWGGKSTEWKGWQLNGDEDDFHSGECGGINIHASGMYPHPKNEGANSLGCQLVYATDYYDFGKKVGFLSKDLTEDPPKTDLSTSLHNHIGNSKYKVDINVKYILDREYDEKNRLHENDTNSKCRNGVFYPIKHTCITTGDYKCTKC